MNKRQMYVVLGVIAILMIPVIGMQVSDGWQWTLFDFVWAGTLLLGIGLACEWVIRKGENTIYRTAAVMTLITSLLLIWINGAVGIIGDDDGVNILYLGVIAMGFFGSMLTRLDAKGMSHVLFAIAIAVFMIPIVAWFIWQNAFYAPPGPIGVFTLNTIFVILYTVAALLFRQASTSNLN